VAFPIRPRVLANRRPAAGRDRLRGRLVSDELVDQPAEPVVPDIDAEPEPEPEPAEDRRGIYDYEAFEDRDQV
jgi:hypothetical protein